MGDDLAELFRKLRASTAALLNVDLNHLTPAQAIRVDRAAALRLQLDDLQRRQFAGEAIDMKEFCVASEQLEKLVGGDPDVAGAEDDFETRYQARIQEEFAGAHEKLSQLLRGQHERVARFNAGHPDEARLTFERELQARIDKYKGEVIPPKPTVEWVRDGTHCFFSEGFDPNKPLRGSHGFVGWVRGDPSPQEIERSSSPPANTRSTADLDAPPPSPPQTSNQPPPSSTPPAHYLRRNDGFDVIQGGRRDRWSNNG
jgi:hypothetical protein